MMRSLKLLYNSELLLLVEYFECVIPVMYAIHLAPLFHLPNSQFFSELANLSSDKLFQIIRSIAVYALLEFASLVCVHVAFKLKFNTSAFHQLGFILEQNFAYLQRFHFSVCVDANTRQPSVMKRPTHPRLILSSKSRFLPLGLEK